MSHGHLELVAVALVCVIALFTRAAFVIEMIVLTALSIGLSLLTAARTKNENARAAGFEDFDVPTATQDRVRPLLVGTARQRGPNVIWYGDLDVRPITQKVKGSPFQKSVRQVIGYDYYLGMQFLVCMGPGVILRKIWVGEELIFSGSLTGGQFTDINMPTLFGDPKAGGRGGIVGRFRWHDGSPGQAANAYLSTFQDIGGDSPTYPNIAYGVFEGGYVGTSERIDEWSFEVQRIPNGLSLSPAGINADLDANPANFIYELLTDKEWGRGQAPANINVTALQAVGNTLHGEGNGISWLIDAANDKVLSEIERQIDGVVFPGNQDGLWTCKLARADYDINTIPLVTRTLSVESYDPGTWEGTFNYVEVGFSNRANDYTDDTEPAHDVANAMIQGGGTVSDLRPIGQIIKFPGVKDGNTAKKLARRELRQLSVPLTSARILVDRSFYALAPYDVIAWTDAARQITKRAFRIRHINYGRPGARRIALDLIEDVFQYVVGGAVAAPPTQWTPPTTAPVAIATNEQLAFEAPRAMAFRAEDGLATYFWAGGRRGVAVTQIQIWERHDAGVPAGSFTRSGETTGFLLIGKLKNSLAEGTAIPTTGILLLADPDTQTDIEAAFEDQADPEVVGTQLLNLLLIGSEFILCTGASVSGADVQITAAYRGVLGSVQSAHAANDLVYLLQGNFSETAIPETDQVHVKLLPTTLDGTLAIGSATQIAFTMDKLTRRPYAPGRLSLGNTVYATTASLEGAGGAPETFGIDVDFIRRDYRTADGGDEIEALTVDAATLFADFPAANNTTVEIAVFNTSSGAVLLFTLTGITTTSAIPLRIQILKATDGVIPTTMRLDLIERHDEGVDVGLASKHTLSHGFAVTTALTGQFNFGALDTDEVSNLYTATVAGTYAFTLSSAHAAGNIEYRLNGGAFVALIVATTTTGSILGVAVSDTIEVRDRSTETGPRQLDMNAPGAGQDAYAITFS